MGDVEPEELEPVLDPVLEPVLDPLCDAELPEVFDPPDVGVNPLTPVPGVGAVEATGVAGALEGIACRAPCTVALGTVVGSGTVTVVVFVVDTVGLLTTVG